MSRDPHTDARVDALLAVAGFYHSADMPLPADVEADLMREGLSLPPNTPDYDEDLDDREAEA